MFYPFDPFTDSSATFKFVRKEGILEIFEEFYEYLDRQMKEKIRSLHISDLVTLYISVEVLKTVDVNS